MILVDKNIKELVENGKLVIDGFNPENLNGVSYDLTIDYILDSTKEKNDTYDIEPGETVFIKTKEKFRFPDNIVGEVVEKNSRMRQGLKVDAPRYQPGHETYAFLRVQNITNNIITIASGMTIAQMYFEELKDIPDTTYDMQIGASYNREVEYAGFGNYKDEYERQIKKKTEDAKQEIEGVTNKLYANVLSLMGILVAVISLVIVNVNALSQANIDFVFVV